ncbi:MAG TPA: phenylalanine--tRNA ligase subunit beta [Anaerolineaceae bacterium]|nr:phenylalanine--tRNA ligase subunit beta [Anaerolineaceae bacterium]HOV31053.1 phenylalanine--tRNA ligase subunit beta [Anaerolineaceae bacterium]HUM48787.1 phenylalanine--tRNA ligase subunit beta [Anaerolineaceae bacterium]
MKAPLSWIKDYIDVDGLNIEQIAHCLTMVGLEVEGIRLVGLPKPEAERHEFKYEGLTWDREKFVVAEVLEVLPHPNADRLVLCRLNDGTQELIILTGAPNLYPYKGKGELAQTLKVAYAREGAMLYDGHQPGQVLTKLKRAVIRGVESFSMICSEKELGISDEHEGVIILDADAPVGTPLVDYMGDAVFDISILPNMVRDASMLGIARELAAVTHRELRLPQGIPLPQGDALSKRVSLEVLNPELNPRFMLGMVENVQAQPSPYWVQRRLNLAGMRPIDALVDATNYTMLETGEPLHAFDYDLLRKRAGGNPPSIITRTAQPGETLTLLDGTVQPLDERMEVVADSAGPLSLAGIMGGMDSGITSQTQHVLLEAASWNFINIRQTLSKLKIPSEAGWRFSRGVHPALAEQALRLCLQRLLAWGGGRLVEGVLDAYPLPPQDPVVTLTEEEIISRLGAPVSLEEAAGILERLGFECTLQEDKLSAKTPPIRLDIGEGLIGKASLVEEIARIYGYERIPSKRLAVELPAPVFDTKLEAEERIREILVSLGLQDTVAYRQTSPQREARILPNQSIDPKHEYVRIKNPITPDRTVMRTSGLATMLELLEYNSKFRPSLALFEIGPVFLPVESQLLPNEALRLTVGLAGLREIPTWQTKTPEQRDFFDLKGVLEALLKGLHIPEVNFRPTERPTFHPGKCAEVLSGERVLGVFGELHPMVQEHYEFEALPVLAAELDADLLVALSRVEFEHQPLSNYPAMVEDIAVIVPEEVSAAALEAAIRQAGGKLLVNVRLFDIFRGEKLGLGKKSMAYQLTYQAFDRTLTDKDAETIRNRIVRALAREFGAVLRSQ